MKSDRIEEATTVNEELVAAFENLIPQLSGRATPPSAAQLQSIVESPDSVLLIARLCSDSGDLIVGAMTVGVVRSTTAVRAFFEDIVVDEQARGRGIGLQMCQHAITVATRLGANTIDLTSHETRQAANRLYQRIGFVPRQTNLYRYCIPSNTKA